MPKRLAACEPCRLDKVACDHDRPACRRCREQDRGRACTYRDSPFKHKRHRTTAARSGTDKADHARSAEHRSEIATELFPRRVLQAVKSYPNPGYLGDSSHATIFRRLSPSGAADSALALDSDPIADETQVAHGASLLDQMTSSLELNSCRSLLQQWIATGTNLALAGVFTKACMQSSLAVLREATVQSAMHISRRLFERTHNIFRVDGNTSSADFTASFCDANTRWETIGLFFAAVARAAAEINHFPSLYTNHVEQCKVQRIAARFSDSCLEICLTLDALNDLQLMLQYENFILHSCVYGDQSYLSWRKLGDVISGLFALGYHESIARDEQAPAFLQDIRRIAFARAYSADKNVAIFTGRPPRMLGKFCQFDMPRGNGSGEKPDTAFQTYTGPADFALESAWSARCALLKEKILLLHRDDNDTSRDQQTQALKNGISELWLTLPSTYRLETTLKSCEGSPTERDFMLSARLNHLHISFLLNSSLSTVALEQNAELLSISIAMFSLAVEALLLKEQLKNSGTGLVWKIAYYGLPAAGIICLALLNGHFPTSSTSNAVASVVQDLSVLVSHVQSGAWLHSTDPSYRLLHGATKTVQSVLNKVLTVQMGRSEQHWEAREPTQPLASQASPEWMPWVDSGLVPDFELDFWSNLADHPALLDLV